MVKIANENIGLLLELLQTEEIKENSLLLELGIHEHKYLKDLRMNLTSVFSYENLTAKEKSLLALAVAVNERHEEVIKIFTNKALAHGATQQELDEISSLVSLMNVNNIFYRFRHFTQQEYYINTPANIKMNIMVQPVLGKEFFELCSLIISAVNGCELCVNAHEEAVRKQGATQARIFEAVRLGAVIKGLIVLL